MATNRPSKLELAQNDGGTDKPTLTKGGPRPQFSVTAGPLSPTSNSTVKPVRLCVYTMKKELMKEGLICLDSMKFTSGRLTTAKQVLNRVLTHLKIPRTDWKVYGLWLKSENLQLQLKSYHLPYKLFKRWKDLLSQYTNATYENVCTEEPYLCLQRNTFLSLQEEKDLLQQLAPDKTTIDLLYHEAVYNVTKSPYPVQPEELHTLAGLQAAVFRVETGSEAILDLTNFSKFYPTFMNVDTRSLVNKIFSSKPSTALRRIQEQFSRESRLAYDECTDANELKLKYLNKCWKHSMYGSLLFRGQIKKTPKAIHYLYYSDRQVYVAINKESVHILAASSPPEVLLYAPIERLCWEFQPCNEEGEDFYSSLWLEYETIQGERKVFKLLQVFSRQAPMMDAILGRCWDHLDKKEQASPTATRIPHQQVHQPREHKLHCDEFSEDGVCLKSSDTSLTRRGKKGSVTRDDSPFRSREAELSLVELGMKRVDVDDKEPLSGITTVV
ncbi:putative FERM domain-containing protein FRMD8P1 [Halichondria panicea]|uniref:putative FERM domain-containing protein FRMD8P1 n=1 Tax=Halichondria panicea TaxID=6063 RepID=UPI00312BADFC